MRTDSATHAPPGKDQQQYRVRAAWHRPAGGWAENRFAQRWGPFFFPLPPSITVLGGSDRDPLGTPVCTMLDSNQGFLGGNDEYEVRALRGESPKRHMQARSRRMGWGWLWDKSLVASLPGTLSPGHRTADGSRGWLITVTGIRSTAYSHLARSNQRPERGTPEKQPGWVAHHTAVNAEIGG